MPKKQNKNYIINANVKDSGVNSTNESRFKFKTISHEDLYNFENKKIAFNFHYLCEPDNFKYTNAELQWFKKIIERLKSLSEYTRERLERDSRLKQVLHYHPINFGTTNVSESSFGINVLGAEDSAFQFSITVNTGRLHGFWELNVFHVVWLDHEHNLYGG